MSIIAAEIKLYKSGVVSDASTNGGRLSSNEITTAVKNNVLPDVSQADRLAGITQYRKVFYKIENDDDETLSNCLAHLTQVALGDDYAVIFEGTQRDTQADISSPTLYGVGTLKANVSAGGTSLIMVLEDTDIIVIRDTDTIYITDGVNSEYHENVTISKASNEVTITLAGGDTLDNSYLAATPTYIASVIDIGDVECTSDNYTDSEGEDTTFDFTTYPLVMDNIGTVEQTWTLTVEDGGETFSLDGDTLGEIATGQVMTGDYSPDNSDFTKPYFTLDKDGWSGELVGGEIVTFQTHPAAVPLWIKRVVPVASTAYASDSIKINLTGESA